MSQEPPPFDPWTAPEGWRDRVAMLVLVRAGTHWAEPRLSQEMVKNAAMWVVRSIEREIETRTRYEWPERVLDKRMDDKLSASLRQDREVPSSDTLEARVKADVATFQDRVVQQLDASRCLQGLERYLWFAWQQRALAVEEAESALVAGQRGMNPGTPAFDEARKQLETARIALDAVLSLMGRGGEALAHESRVSTSVVRGDAAAASKRARKVRDHRAKLLLAACEEIPECHCHPICRALRGESADPGEQS